MAKTPSVYNGYLVALDKSTGKEVWRVETAYSWSSPLDVYDADGVGYIVYCNSAGSMHLINGRTGERYMYLSLNGNIEASPAAFNEYVVVGTRAQRTYCVKVG